MVTDGKESTMEVEMILVEQKGIRFGNKMKKMAGNFDERNKKGRG